MAKKDSSAYAGATRKITAAKVRKLGQHWAVQRKYDGVYAQIKTDESGLIIQTISRSGRILACESARSMLGVATGAPDSIIVAELETSTEVALRDVGARGYCIARCFDVLRLEGRSVQKQPYKARYGALVANQERQQERQQSTWWLDANGYAHHERTGRFCKPIPRDWRRIPVVEQYPLSSFADQWDRVRAENGEGLVLVNTEAPAGGRGAKLKCKLQHTTDATVVLVEERQALVDYYGLKFAVPVGKWDLDAGDIVELTSNGFYDSGIPRHARITRIRTDLM